MNASDQDTLKMLTDLLTHRERIIATGADDTMPAWGDLARVLSQDNAGNHSRT